MYFDYLKYLYIYFDLYYVYKKQKIPLENKKNIGNKKIPLKIKKYR